MRASPSNPTTSSSTPLLECRDLSVGYGQMAVVRELDLHVGAGEIVALIGPNGAGKTTTLLALAGELPPLSGEIRWNGEPTAAPLHRRAHDGLGFVTEERSVIMNLTTSENLRLAGVSAADAMSFFPELEPLMGRQAGLLSGGEQQMLTLARQLARRPTVLLADELSLGLAPLVVQRLLAAVRDAATSQGIGIILVEQHVQQALAHADRVCVMRRGRIVVEGTPDQLNEQLDQVEQAYLSTFDANATADAPAPTAPA